MRQMLLGVLVAVGVVLGGALGVPGVAGAQGPGQNAVYALTKGCYVLQAGGGFVVKDRAGGYAASAQSAGQAERFRFQAVTLGRYLLYGAGGDHLATASSTGGSVVPAKVANENADWKVEAAGAQDTFTFRLANNTARALAVGGDRRVVAGGAPTALKLVPAQGCATFPEVETNVTGTPMRGAAPWSEVKGTVDAHMHLMAFEFLGGSAHCGRPWHPYGVTQALVDCPDHYPAQGSAALLENVISKGNPPLVRPHDPVGWPTFKDWPAWGSLTHESSYYKWLERAWRSGLRLYTNLLVDNHVLCDLYPLKRHGCNEMQTIKLEAQAMKDLQDYIDAQEGGPGKGWFRIVKDPYDARRIINDGKLAVIMGIEVSKLFDCGVYNDQPTCTQQQIDSQLDEVYDMGVRQMELINKFDNGFGGVAGDEGTTGVITNVGNKLATGKFLDMRTCTGHSHDREQQGIPAGHQHNSDSLIANGIQAFVPPGTAPIYPAAPHCNAKGLTPLGEHLVKRMIEKKMIIDPDHLSVLARNQLLNVVEQANYPGIISSHSWSTADAFPRIYKLGGFITPYAGDSTGFVNAWRSTKQMRAPGYYFGFGFGADANGFGAQGPPRPDAAANPVTYPFRSPLDPGVTVGQQRSGERVYDINKDGVAHYGLYADWLEDLRKLAGDEIVADMNRGAEAYLQTWERADGVPRPGCQPLQRRLAPRGTGAVTYGTSAEELLKSAGQPVLRGPRAWEFCIAQPGGTDAPVYASLDDAGRVALVGSRAKTLMAFGLGVGDKAKRARRLTKRALGRSDIRIRSNRAGGYFVYGMRGGRIAWTAAVTKAVGRDGAQLRRHIRQAGLAFTG